jgi:hypothetical protein
VRGFPPGSTGFRDASFPRLVPAGTGDVTHKLIAHLFWKFGALNGDLVRPLLLATVARCPCVVICERSHATRQPGPVPAARYGPSPY